jgi:hypothetical protein
MTRQLSIVTGCSAGATESFVVVPFELVKIKYAPPRFCYSMLSQTDICRLQDKSLAGTYSGPLDVVRQIVRRDGILGLYAGMEATFWRYVVLPCHSSDRAVLTPNGVVTGTCGGTEVTSDPSSKSRRCFQRRRSAASPVCIQAKKLDDFLDTARTTLEQFRVRVCWGLCRNCS